MKQTNILKSSIFSLMMFLGTLQFLWGQGSETFQTQTALTTSYANGTFVGETTGVTVNYVHSRNEGVGTTDDYAIEEKGIMLRRADEPSSVEFVIANGGGVGTFSFDARKAFTGGSDNRAVAIYANNNLIYTTPNFGTSGADATVHSFSADVNLSGNVTIRLTYPAGTPNGNRQITIDNVSWTAHSEEEPQDPPIVTDETFNGNVGVDASFQIQATESPDTYEISSGTLPDGLTLDEETGLISGTPTNAGNSSVTVTATNEAGTSPTATINFQIQTGVQTVTPEFLNISKYDTDLPFNLPANTDQGISITYNSDDTSVASIAGNIITINGIGITTITASNAGNSNYNAFSDSFTLTVTEEPEMYDGNGTFVKINSIDELTNGYYVIAANPDFGNWAMSNEHNGTFLSRTAITPTAETIIDPDVTIVWKIESNGAGRTIYNDNSAKYVSFTGSGNNVQIVDEVTADNQRWNITVGTQGEQDVFLFNNVAITNRILQYNSNTGQERFAAYTSDQKKFILYKLSESTVESVIWTTANEWSNGTGPTISDDVIIEGNLNTTSDLSAKSLTVSTGASIVVSSGNTLTVEGAITNNTSASGFIVQNNANLIQNTGATADNTGNITVQKTSQPFKRLDYTMWSSPVAGQQLQAFSPETLPNRIYIYQADAYYEVNNADENFEIGNGYLFRAPNNWESDTATPYSGQFIGIPSNGTLLTAVFPDAFTSLGNPYASNIDADAFLAANPEVSSLYFWTNTNPVVDDSYSGNNYATYTYMGGVGTSGPENNETTAPDGIISVGQGFIAQSGNIIDVEFNNDMRVADPATFFRVNDMEKHRFWINLKGENQGHNQILVGYMDGATQGIDKQIDAKMFEYQGSALYNLINDEKYTIQGRALPFETSDVVPLGFKAVKDGSFTISLVNFDGMFAEGSAIVYLKDNETQTTHNLMESDYTFSSEIGEFNQRFEIVYEDSTMGTGDLTANSIQIYKDNQNIVVDSKSEKILSVELYDLSGRNIHSNNKVNANSYQIKSNSKGVLIVKVQTQKGQILTKRIINN